MFRFGTTLRGTAITVLLGLTTSAGAGTAVYTADTDAQQITDANVAYNGGTILVTGGPTADPPPRGSLVDVALPGLSAGAAEDALFEMRFVPGQTPTTNGSEASAPSGVNCGISMEFDGGTLSVAWGASFNVYSVAAVFFPANPGAGVIAQSAGPVASDLRALRLIRSGENVIVEYDTDSGTETLTTVDLNEAGSQNVDVSDDNVTYRVVSSNTFGSASYDFQIEAISVCGAGVPTMNNGAGPCDIGGEGEQEGEAEGEEEGETPCTGTLSIACPNFDSQGIPLYAFLDGILPFPVDWFTSDLTQSGIPDSWEVALLADVLCNGGVSDSEALVCAYEANLNTFRNEPGYFGFSAFEHVIVALLTLSTEGQASLSSLGLVGNYEIAGAAAKAAGEPFSADGDLDFDGATNLTEFNNTVGASLARSDYVIAATSFLLDGTAGAAALPVTSVLGIGAGLVLLAGAGAGALRRRKR